MFAYSFSIMFLSINHYVAYSECHGHFANWPFFSHTFHESSLRIQPRPNVRIIEQLECERKKRVNTTCYPYNATTTTFPAN